MTNTEHAELDYPSVSVIVPAYNASGTITRCIEALRKQEYPSEKIEIIVVDDGSTDDTAILAEKAGATVIRQTNGGPAKARNNGAGYARGEIIVFTDSDCFPTPRFVNELVSAFFNPSVQGSKGAYYSGQDSLTAQFVQAEYEERYDRMRSIESIDFIDTYAAAFRRETFRAMGGYDERFTTASVEDQEFSFRMAGQGYRMVFRPEARTYHLHADSFWRYARKKFWIGFWKIRVLKDHPSKAKSDSHTPVSLKLQIVTLPAAVKLGTLVVFSPKFALTALIPLTIFALSSLPLIFRCWRKNAILGCLSPAWILARTVSLTAGMLLGAVSFIVSGLRRKLSTADIRTVKEKCAQDNGQETSRKAA